MLTLLFSLIYIVLACQISTFCTTIYLHRSLTHRAIELNPVLSALIQLWLWLHTGIVPREWAAVHRKHHAFSDREGDPHSPHLEGLWKVLLANAYLYRKEANNRTTISRYTRDIKPYWLERRVVRHGTLGVALGMLLAILLLGPVAGPIAFLLQGVVYILLNSMINSICHWVGYKNFDNTATNLKLVAWLTAGEGLHNNHHHRPSSPKMAMRRREVDPAWLVIRLLTALRLARI